MKQDQTGKIWENNQMVGYIDEDTGELFGINPSTGYAVFVSKEAGRDPFGKLKKWVKSLVK